MTEYASTMDEYQLAAWLDARAGKLTASRMGDAMDFTKGGAPSAKRRQYMVDLVAERMTGVSVRHYVTAAMQWGLAHEAEAKRRYELETGAVILPTGFCDHPEIEYFGATPDGLVDDGLIEVKCPTTSTYIEWLAAGEVPAEHKPQMLAQCLCTGRPWVDFVAFDPRIKSHKLQYFTRRFVPTRKELDAVRGHAQRFLDETEQLFRRIVENGDGQQVPQLRAVVG